MGLTVLHVIPSFLGGGAERQLSLLAPELCRLGVATHVAYSHEGVNLRPLRTSSVVLHPVIGRGNYDPYLLVKIVSIIRKVRPDIVQTWLPQMDTLAGLASLLTRTPFILSERSSAAAYNSGWKHRLRRHVGIHARAIVANSRAGLHYWEGSGNRQRVIRNGVDFAAVSSSRSASPASVGLPRDARIILFAGRLIEVKNVSRLLDGLDRVLATRPDTAALLFGEGHLRGALESKIASLGTRSRVRLLGFTTELLPWMRRAAAFVSVSHFEGQPNTVLEAAAVGCPLVLSSIEPHKEILDHNSARFCEPLSIPDIARAIGEVLDKPEAASARAATAQRLAESWSISHTAQEHLKLYGEIVRERI
jgi:glycosyltransferase involved in cell wall biosynthesis